MNYRRIYDKLIGTRRLLARCKSDGNYYESHHITPLSLGGSSDPDNLILLTAREHFVAHRLLAKAYPKSQKLLFAVASFQMDKDGERKLNSRQIETARRSQSNAARSMQLERSANNKHASQSPESRLAFGERSSELQQELVEQGKHYLQSDLHKQRNGDFQRQLAGEGKHAFQKPENRAKIVANARKQITCPHCGKTGGAAGMRAWHFNNCKLKNDCESAK